MSKDNETNDYVEVKKFNYKFKDERTGYKRKYYQLDSILPEEIKEFINDNVFDLNQYELKETKTITCKLNDFEFFDKNNIYVLIDDIDNNYFIIKQESVYQIENDELKQINTNTKKKKKKYTSLEFEEIKNIYVNQKKKKHLKK